MEDIFKESKVYNKSSFKVLLREIIRKYPIALSYDSYIVPEADLLRRENM